MPCRQKCKVVVIIGGSSLIKSDVLADFCTSERCVSARAPWTLDSMPVGAPGPRIPVFKASGLSGPRPFPGVRLPRPGRPSGLRQVAWLLVAWELPERPGTPRRCRSRRRRTLTFRDPLLCAASPNRMVEVLDVLNGLPHSSTFKVQQSTLDGTRTHEQVY